MWGACLLSTAAHLLPPVGLRSSNTRYAHQGFFTSSNTALPSWLRQLAPLRSPRHSSRALELANVLGLETLGFKSKPFFKNLSMPRFSAASVVSTSEHTSVGLLMVSSCCSGPSPVSSDFLPCCPSQACWSYPSPPGDCSNPASASCLRLFQIILQPQPDAHRTSPGVSLLQQPPCLLACVPCQAQTAPSTLASAACLQCTSWLMAFHRHAIPLRAHCTSQRL